MEGYRVNNEKPMRSVSFFNTYFSNFGRIVLANILFLPFNILAVAYLLLMYKSFGGINIPAAAPVLIILNMGMSGVALVCRYICSGKNAPTVQTFLKGVKENIFRFSIHGAVFTAVFIISYFSVVLYYRGTKSSAFFWLLLIITALISLVVLFASYYMNIMTVTMDLSLKDTYRNCFFFSFGELKNNLMATAGIIIMAAVIFSVIYIVNNLMVVLIVLAIMQIFLIPATMQYIITFYVYDDMIGILDLSKRRQKSDDDEADDSKKETERPKIDREEAEEISRLVDDTKDEYIFYNGKMILRSELKKALEQENE